MGGRALGFRLRSAEGMIPTLERSAQAAHKRSLSKGARLLLCSSQRIWKFPKKLRMPFVGVRAIKIIVYTLNLYGASKARGTLFGVPTRQIILVAFWGTILESPLLMETTPKP